MSGATWQQDVVPASACLEPIGPAARPAPYPRDVTSEYNPRAAWFIEKCRELEDDKQVLIHQKLELRQQLKDRSADVKKLQKELEGTKDLVRDLCDKVRDEERARKEAEGKVSREDRVVSELRARGKAAAEDARKKGEQIKRMQMSLMQASREREQLEESMAEVKTKATSRVRQAQRDAERRVWALKQSMEKVEGDANRKNAEARSMMAEVETLQHGWQQMEAKVAQAEEEKERRVTAAERRAEVAENKAESASSELETMQGRVRSLQRELDSAYSQLAEAVAEVKLKTDEADGMRQRMREYEVGAREQREQVKQIEGQRQNEERRRREAEKLRRLDQVSYADARQRGKAMEATARYLQFSLAPVAANAVASAAAHVPTPLLSAPGDGERSSSGGGRRSDGDRPSRSRRRGREEEEEAPAPMPGSSAAPLNVMLVPTHEWRSWLAGGGVEPAVREAPDAQPTGAAGATSRTAGAAGGGEQERASARWEVPVPAARAQAVSAHAPSPLPPPGHCPVADALRGNPGEQPLVPPARPAVVVRETHVVPRNRSHEAQLLARGLVRQPADERARRGGGKRAKVLPPPGKKKKGAEGDEAVQEALRRARDIVLVDRFLVVPYDPSQEEEMHTFLDGYKPRPRAAEAEPAPAPQAGGRRVAHSAQVQAEAEGQAEAGGENEDAAVKGAPIRAVDVHVGAGRQPLAMQTSRQEV